MQTGGASASSATRPAGGRDEVSAYGPLIPAGPRLPIPQHYQGVPQGPVQVVPPQGADADATKFWLCSGELVKVR